MRQKLEHPSFMVISHSNEVFSIDFSPFNEHIFLSGAGDNAVCLWDLRNLSTSLYKFEGHSKSVLKVEWCPYNEAMFASCSEDRRVNVWDLSKLGETQKSEDKEPFDGPPELMVGRPHAVHPRRPPRQGLRLQLELQQQHVPGLDRRREQRHSDLADGSHSLTQAKHIYMD